MPVSDYESYVLVELVLDSPPATLSGGTDGETYKLPIVISATPRIKRILRTYEDKARSEDDLALLRDAFAPDHERRFDVIPVHHQPT